MGRVSLCLVIMFFICSAQKIDAQVQNIREKQDTISATKSLEHIRPENIKKGPLNNALDVLSGQSAGVNVTTNGTDRLAMLNSIRVRGTTSIMGGNDPLVIIDGVTWLSGNFWLVSFKISYLCLPLFYETRTTPSCHPSGCAYRQL